MVISRLHGGIGAGAALACLIFASTPLLAQSGGEVPITTSSKEALALFRQGRDLVENVELAAARPLLDQAIGKDPSFALAYAYRASAGGDFSLQQQNMEKAVLHSAKASPGERHWILALKGQFDGLPIEQKAHIKELLGAFPQDKHVHLLAGTYFQGIPAELGKAIEHFGKAADIDKSFAAAFNSAGYAYSRMEKYGAAEEAFKRYIALRPGNPNPYDSYAELLLKLGRYPESIAQYRKALGINPAFTSAYAGTGHNHVFMGEFTKAREDYQMQFDRATSIDDRLAALYWKAVSYVHERKVKEAQQCLEERRALAEREKAPIGVLSSHWVSAILLWEMGSLPDSARDLEAATKFLATSNLPEVQKDGWKPYLQMGRAQVLARIHEFEQARRLLDQCRAIMASRKDDELGRALHASLAVLALEEGQYDAALDHFRKADREDPYVWYYEATAFEKKGDLKQAAQLREKVASWNQNNLNLALVRSRAKQ